jgi:hypothetical protein
MKEKEQVIIKPIYDTIFNFDSTGKICLACYKTKTSSASKFIILMVTTYSCNYLYKKNEKLYIKTSSNDTCSLFSLGKNSIRQYSGNTPLFVASVKNKKYMLTKDFLQLTFKDYQEISLCEEPYFYVTQNPNEGEVLLTGLVNKKKKRSFLISIRGSGSTRKIP